MIKERVLRICRKFGLILVINILCVLTIFSNVYGQECEYLPEDEGGEHFIIIDDDPFFFTTVEESKRMQDQLYDCRLLEDELDYREQQIDIYKNLVRTKSEMIDNLEQELEFQIELNEQRDSSKGFWSRISESPRFNLMAGFVIGGAVVGTTLYIVED